MGLRANCICHKRFLFLDFEGAFRETKNTTAAWERKFEKSEIPMCIQGVKNLLAFNADNTGIFENDIQYA